MLFFFFFQAEDGIRDSSVTGVQTCALPICCKSGSYVRSDPAGENPAGKEKQKSLSRQRGDSLSEAFRIARIGSGRQSIKATGQRVHQPYHDHGCDNTAQQDQCTSNRWMHMVHRETSILDSAETLERSTISVIE